MFSDSGRRAAMAPESLSPIGLQSEGLRSIGEPTALRPSGVQQQQGSTLVVVDVNKGVAPAAVYWTLENVVRQGDHLKILGIFTHVPNSMGFMVQVDLPTRNKLSLNILQELQFEIDTKKEAIWRTALLKEWCEKAGVKLEVDVKAGNNPKVIASDEAKAMGASHVILDKTMKDRKYFIDNLSCFVSRIRSNGGVDTLRPFAVINKLPPMAPVTPKKTARASGHHLHPNPNESGHRSSLGSTSSYRGSSMSSTSIELGREPCDDDFSAQEAGDPVPMLGTIEVVVSDAVQGSSLSNAAETPRPPQFKAVRSNPQLPNQLFNLLRTPDASNKGINLNSSSSSSKSNSNSNSHGLSWNSNLGSNPNSNELNWNNNFSSSKGLNWNPEPWAPLTPRSEFRLEQGSLQSGSFASFQPGWVLQLNVASQLEFGTQTPLGRTSLATSSQTTQASFSSSCSRRKHSLLRSAEKITMDLHWPLMHWADCRAFKLRSQHHGSSSLISSSSNSSFSNFRARRRVVVSGLNYSDMVDSD